MIHQFARCRGPGRHDARLTLALYAANMRSPHDALLDQIERIAQDHLRRAEDHRRWAVKWHALADRLDARKSGDSADMTPRVEEEPRPSRHIRDAQSPAAHGGTTIHVFSGRDDERRIPA